MLDSAKRYVKRTLDRWPAKLLKDSYDLQKFWRVNERPIEFSYVFRMIGQLQPKTVLDVGTGKTALPALIRDCGPVVTAIDNISDYWTDPVVNRYFHIIDDDITKPSLTGSFDMVMCISVLEHIKRADIAVRNIFGLLRPGGHLVLTVPYSERQYVHNCYDLPDSRYGKGSPFITQAFSREQVNQWLTDNGATLEHQEFWQFFEGEHWTQGDFVVPPVQVGVADRHQHSCMLLRKPD